MCVVVLLYCLCVVVCVVRAVQGRWYCRGVVCGDNNKVIGAGTTELLTGLLIGLLMV